MIVRIEHVFADLPGCPLALRPHMRLVLNAAERLKDATYIERAPQPGALAEGPRAIAYVNQGRWVVDCPFEGCASAQLCSPEDPRFFCAECFNRKVDQQWVPVRFPPARSLAAIERELEVRPDPETRNWFPHETVRDLVAENKANLL